MRKLFAVLLPLLFLALLVLQWLHLPITALRSALSSVQPLYLLAGGVVLVASVGMQAWRWHSLMPQAWGVSRKQTFEATYLGLWFNLLPGRVGDAIRPYAIALQSEVSYAAVVGTAVWDRLLDILVVLPLVLYTALLPGLRQVAPGLWSTVMLFAIALVALLLLVLLRPNLVALFRFLPRRAFAFLLRTQNDFYTGMGHTYHSGGGMRAICWGVAVWVVNVLGYWLVLGGFSLPAELQSVQAAVVVTVVSAFAHVVPAAGAGLGVLNYAVVVALTYLLHLHGLPETSYTADIVAAALLLYVVLVVPDVVIGGWCYFKKRHLLSQ